jgi:methionyl-tRNA synthetase
MENITYDDFKKLEMRIGWIRFVEPVEGTDKLLRFEIDFGPEKNMTSSDEEMQAPEDNENEKELPFGKEEYRGRDVRQIVSGIREFFPKYKALEGKKALYVVNLEPREIRGVMSYGMLMAVDGLDGQPVFLTAEGTVEAGSSVR